MTTVQRALAALLLLMPGFSLPAQAIEGCPTPTEPVYPEESDQAPIEFTADDAEVSADGISRFRGRVIVRQGFRELEAEQVEYDDSSGNIKVEGRTTYREPAFEISAEDGRYDSRTGEAHFSAGTYVVPSRPARGTASEVRASSKGKIALEDVKYTTCMEEDPDWQLHAEDLDLNLRESRGVARKVKLDFKGVRLLYFPYLSFPLNDDRKTGLLLPEFRNSDRSGTEIQIPFYLNIAPNQDATITGRWMSERGLQLQNEYRYLTRRSRGQADLEYLPSDDKYGDDRYFSSWRHLTRYQTGWRTSVDVKDASDREYLEDLGSSIADTSQTHLLRNAEVSYLGTTWNFVARVRNYQTIDVGISDEDKPADRLPQFLLSGLWQDGPLGLSYGFDTELVNFDVDEGTDGTRFSLEPSVSLPVEGPGYFFIPGVRWRLTEYDLDGDGDLGNDQPSLEAPIASLDTGLIFERQSSTGKYVQILQPRMLFAYIPFRNQDDIPVFDSGEPDFNYVQLFRPNRFVGGDRIGDTSQLSVGLTTRLLASATGREFLRATLGQAFYFDDRRVVVPGCEEDDDNQSDLVAELGLDIFRNWNADLGYHWDVNDSETRLAEARIQYRPAENKVINASYRYRPGILEQASVSGGWPLSRRWSFVGAIDYSLRDESTIDRMLGLQYESCCWAIRFASSRQVSNRDGSKDTSFLLQLDFKGLAGLGSNARNRFERDILGYSVYE
ncbi:MAG: LPS assembly protein LptD [Gammaproteobacteria bacterium]|jgi:LPS-assembly protein